MPVTELEERITTAVAAVARNVAGVESLRTRRPTKGADPDVVGRATAVVLEPGGLLVTNFHVVDGADRIRVHLPDGRDLEGRAVGGDPATDVALVKVDGIQLTPAELGDSERLRVGQPVLAVGYALGLPGEPTVSLGVVSALHRPLPGSDFIFEGLVQTDAAINPGNSGGPLVDLDGRVVGINAAMVAFAQGVGFALPIHAVVRIADELRQRGRVVRPWIGVKVAELGPDLARQHGLPTGSGLWVAEVVARSPAHRAGVRPGDLLQQLGPFPIQRVRDLLEGLAKFPVGSDVPLGLQRRGQPVIVSVPVQEGPEAAPLAPAP
jgi:serine protease Do